MMKKNFCGCLGLQRKKKAKPEKRTPSFPLLRGMTNRNRQFRNSRFAIISTFDFLQDFYPKYPLPFGKQNMDIKVR